MIDTAYSNEALPLHTDCTYLTQQPGLQLFNCAAQASYPILHSTHFLNKLYAPTACADSLSILNSLLLTTIRRLPARRVSPTVFASPRCTDLPDLNLDLNRTL